MPSREEENRDDHGLVDSTMRVISHRIDRVTRPICRAATAQTPGDQRGRIGHRLAVCKPQLHRRIGQQSACRSGSIEWASWLLAPFSGRPMTGPRGLNEQQRQNRPDRGRSQQVHRSCDVNRPARDASIAGDQECANTWSRPR
jgi:hypothetical protein